jgi:vancomycin resistance protein YoaR
VANSEEYVSALRSFLERKGEVNILLEGEPDTKSPLFEMFNDFKKQINIKITKARPRINSEEINFCVVDKSAYRIETDKLNKKARGSFYDKKQSRELISAFEKMLGVKENLALNL